MSFDDSSQSASKALSHSQSMGRGCGCFSGLFFGFFILVGTVAIFPLFLFPFMKYLEATSWVETPCEIISSNVIEKDGQPFIAVEYSYRTHGENFRSKKYRNYEVAGSSRSGLLKTVNKLRPGTKTVCYVNPENISEAVLDRSFSPMLLLGLIPLVFVIIGLFGIIFARHLAQSFITSRLAGVKNEEWRTETAIKIADEFSEQGWQTREWQLKPESSGPVELKSGSNTAVGLIFITFFALFWNGIVSVFLFEVAGGWMRGKPDWFLTIFLIPFVLVGIGTILAAIYMFLSLFNPKPRLFVSDATTTLGETFDISWQFKGSTSSIRRLQVQLVGTEWAQYQQGTSTHTDTEEFYCLDLFDTDQPLEMPEGKLEVAIPQNTMHSFNTSSNKIKWSLRIKGDIPMWPDVNQSYDFTVLPFSVE